MSMFILLLESSVQLLQYNYYNQHGLKISTRIIHLLRHMSLISLRALFIILFIFIIFLFYFVTLKLYIFQR